MKSKDLILEQYDNIQDRRERLILEVLLEGVEILNDIRDQLKVSKLDGPQTSEKEAEKKSPSAGRPVQKKLEGAKYDPNGPPSEKQWWRLDEIKKQVSHNRWREFLDDAEVSLETELTLSKASKIIEETKRKV